MLVLVRLDVEVFVIICVSGNMEVDYVCWNVLCILIICDYIEVNIM